jgi:hypothetical protein
MLHLLVGEEKMSDFESNDAGEEKYSSRKSYDNYISSNVKNEITVAPNSIEVSGDKNDIWFEARKIVGDWESAHHRSLRGKNKDIALRAAYTQLTQKRGIIRLDIENWYHYNSNYARRKLYLLQNQHHLLVPLKGGRRIRRFQQYCIATERDKFSEEKQSRHIGIDFATEENQSAETLIQHLVVALSRRKPRFHKLHFYTKLPPEIYTDIDWTIPSMINKGKVKEFRLDYRRSVGFEIFPDGAAVIQLTCTDNPYELHAPSGMMDFISSLGEARSILKGASKDQHNIPPVTSWKLKMFDKDKTISLSELEKDIPQVIKWWSREGMKVEYLGQIFQLYGKVMPEIGAAFRLEVQSTVEEKDKDLAEVLIQKVFPEVEFQSALELLERRVERLENNKRGDNNSR